jgi:ABC-type branched-subunit amino acid transport system permease subunit
VLGYRGSGVINFAQGGIGMYTAYVYVGLRTTGRYLLPVPGLPGFVQLGPKSGYSTWPSMAFTFVTVVLLGLIVHFLFFRPLRHAPTIAKVAASIGLMLSLQAIVAYRYGTETVPVPSLLPQGNAFELNGTKFPIDRLIIAGAAILAAVALWALFKFTRFGLATRAAAENERGAMLLGVSPEFQAAASWVLATVLATIGSVLVAPLTQLTPTGFTLLVIPALAAGLIARFTSFSITVAAALVVSVVTNIVANLAYKYPKFPSVGWPDAIPFVVIIVVMFVGGKSLPERGQAVEGKLQAVPPTRRRIVVPAVVFAIFTFLIYNVSAGYRLALINAFIGAIVALSIVVITGYMAQISLLQMTLAGVSAYVLAGLTTAWGIPFPLSPILAIAGATVVGMVAALPALRVRGVNLAVITLAGGHAIEGVIFNNEKYAGGFDGALVTPAKIFGYELSYSRGRIIGQPSFALFALIAVTAMAFVVSNLRRSSTGRRMLAVRTNERAAASMGINIAKTKFVAFGISSMIAGVAGVLVAYQQTRLSPQSFSVWVTIAILAIAFLGGITTVTGGLIAGALTAGALMPEVLDDLIFSKSHNGLQLQNLIGGMGLILTAILNPEGISGAMRITGQQLKGLYRRLTGTVPVPAGDIS